MKKYRTPEEKQKKFDAVCCYCSCKCSNNSDCILSDEYVTKYTGNE